MSASPVLHIKDSYYFDVPKILWRHNYTSLDEVPPFLRQAHPDATPADFNKALAGKILIPQPFAELKNLYEKKSGFAISRYMLIEVVVGLLLIWLFSRLAVRMRSSVRPVGKSWNALEAVLVYIKDNIAEPAIGHHDAHRFLPFLWTVFFFVLTCNLFGLLPWVGAPTSSFSVTLALAGLTFATVLIFGSLKFGPIGFWLNQVPQMDLPLPMALLLKPMIFLIEVLGLGIKHGVLAIRLLANMVAGHLVILGILAMAFSIEGARSSSWPVAAPIAVLGVAAFNFLELLVAFLQAYIFTFLSALFIGAAVHHH